ncbi:MAG: hypothetical protein J1F22_08295 [Lachnospiraceae bacterium]|nr:hypothetical protein [Lachnospiraceae bacterium]
MQREYKDAMEKITLSDSDKERILANVKKAQEQPADKVIRFSFFRIGTVAAAVVVVLVSAALIRSQFIGNDNGPGNITDPGTPGQLGTEIVWEELDSIDDIETKTDCKTYLLGDVSEQYKVKKVEVAQSQKHVKITYRNKEENDRILFEYKEEENAQDITSQFDHEAELSVEKVGDSDVKMYGVDSCDGMTWQQESCTFAVKLSKGCSKERAKKLVSGTKKKESGDGNSKDDSQKGDKGDDEKKNPNAIGWTGDEKATGPKEKKNILKKIYNQLGFRVTIEPPAKKVTYKKVGDFESFAFYYNEREELEKHRIIGYAGWDGCPKGVMNGYEEIGTVSANGVRGTVSEKETGEKLFSFTKQDISFTLLIEDWTGDDTEGVLGELLSVIRISLDDGDPEEDPEEESEEEAVKTKALREMAQKIQDIVADGSFKELAAFINYPIMIYGPDIEITGVKEFQSVVEEPIFTSDWIDAVVSYDTGRIKADTKSIRMGDSKNYIICKIKGNGMDITEIRIAPKEPAATASPDSFSD